MTNKEIETRLLNLEKAFIQSQQNGVIQTQTVDKNKSDISVNSTDIDSLNTSQQEQDDIIIELLSSL